MRLLVESKRPDMDLQSAQLAGEGGQALSLESPEGVALALQQLQAPAAPDARAIATAKKQSLIKQVEKAIDENEQQAVEILKEWIKEA